MIESLDKKEDQPDVIACIAISKLLNGDIKTGNKFIDKAMKQNKNLKYDHSKAALLPTIKAMITHYYELEKKSFNAHYEKYKLVSSIGNNSKNYLIFS